MPFERRRHNRFEIPAPIEINIENAGGRGAAHTDSAGELINISESGARFETHTRLAVGTALTLHVVISCFSSGETYLELPAEVRWVAELVAGGPYDVGVEFTYMRPEYQCMLQDHLASLSPW